MNKKIIFPTLAIIFIFLMAYMFTNTSRLENKEPVTGPANATYSIDGETVVLLDGSSEIVETPGSASKITTNYFGNEFSTDLDGDGQQDAVFFITQNSGGTGTFFYLVAALDTDEGWEGSQGLFLGDRIAPQSIGISTNPDHKNVIVVDYLDRKSDEGMATQPSIEKTIWLKFDAQSMSFGEVEQDFEGEANPDIMTLGMKSWQWVKTAYNNDTEVIPNDADAFTITFSDDGTFSATTDCNGIGGSYTIDGNQITFGEDMMMTQMFCEDSQEQVFASVLGEVQSFFFTDKGELIFEIKYDSGSVVFK